MQHNKPNNRKVIFATVIGSFLEFFDFTVYNFFAIEIGKAIFANQSIYISTLLSWSVFAVGYIIRPLGSYLFGKNADKYGRAKALYYTMVTMATGNAILCIVPPSKSIGALAALIVIFARLLQGLAAGAESSIASLVLAEGKKEPGRYLSYNFFAQSLSGCLGAVISTILHYRLSPEQLVSWGWRVPFLIALLLAPIALWLRSYTRDIDKKSGERKAAMAAPYHPTKTILTKYGWVFFLDIMTIWPTSVAIYSMVFYMPHLLIHLGVTNSGFSFSLSVYANLIMAIGAFVGGLYADKVKNIKQIIVPFLLWILFCSFVSFTVLNHNGVCSNFYISYFITVASIGFLMPTSALLVLPAFPKEIRARANGLGYSIGVALFGGSTNLIITWLQHQFPELGSMVTFYYLLLAMIVGIIIFMIFPNRNYLKEEMENSQ